MEKMKMLTFFKKFSEYKLVEPNLSHEKMHL